MLLLALIVTDLHYFINLIRIWTISWTYEIRSVSFSFNSEVYRQQLATKMLCVIAHYMFVWPIQMYAHTLSILYLRVQGTAFWPRCEPGRGVRKK
jgi:hypothetical protein